MINESILKDVRHCLYSEIDCDSKELNYNCTLMCKKCILMKEPFCEKREEFPTEYDT
jgi:hypothetical protein